ncbi:MAG TPA: UvrB/UvrC motif-containing protein [Planctomycetota bacterium]|nr:UvrB/UvrC motif-containing protein [Planctomycetota bacterium]
MLELGLCEFCAKKFMLFEGSCPSVQALATRAEAGAAPAPSARTPQASASEESEATEVAQSIQFPASLTEKLKSFQKTGRLSGPEDYAALESQLKMLFQKIQGGPQHTGKTPHAPKAVHSRNNQRTQLETELAQAVKAENYEKAAQLRDQIKKLNEAPLPPAEPKEPAP